MCNLQYSDKTFLESISPLFFMKVPETESSLKSW